MTDRIRIADLRHDIDSDLGNSDEDCILTSVQFEDGLLALLDAAEASNDWHALAEYGEAPEAVDLRLHAALARFDFGAA